MTTTTANDTKVLVCLNSGAEEPESVLIAFLVGVEALRAGKEAVMFLTRDAIYAATPGFAEKVDVPGAPSIAALNEEYVTSGGRLFACPVCVKVRDAQNSEWLPNATVAGMPSVYEYTQGGALVFNY
jgi:predicted peroxiredoxin